MKNARTAAQVDSRLYDTDYYERSCGDFDLFAGTGGRVLARKKQFILSLALIGDGARVLDAGCGRGEFSAHFANRGAAVDCVDYSADSVVMTRETARRFGHDMDGRMRPARCDVKALPFPAGAFDRIVMADIVEHMFEWELGAAFAEMARVLAPGGVLIVHTAPNRWRDIYNWPFKRLARIVRGEDVRKERRTADELELHVNIQSPRTLSRHLSRDFAFRVWTMRPELLYPMSAYERFRAKDPLNALGSRDIWAIAVHRSRGAGAVRRHLSESFYANRMLEMGINEWRFVRSGLGKWIDGSPVTRPVEGEAKFEIPVDGQTRRFEIAFSSTGYASVRVDAGDFLREKFEAGAGGVKNVSFGCARKFRRAVVPVSVLVDGDEMNLARLGFA